jgi:4-hydroxyproline epimerase
VTGTIEILDSHTEGEPTRLLLGGDALPELGDGTMAERRDRLAAHHDWLRGAALNEPRAPEPTVGVLVCTPQDPAAVAGAIFFNRGGYLTMCGHALIGLITSFAELGRLEAGRHAVETPAGTVHADLRADGTVALHNIPSYRWRAGVTVELHGRMVSGDIAWGGNWFFITADHEREIDARNVQALTAYAAELREALAMAGATGRDGAAVDHMQLVAGGTWGADGRMFMLGPGTGWDRSPCGTGTSARLACLHADGQLEPGALWIQESVIGTRFTATYEPTDPVAGCPAVLPTITGRAWTTLRGSILLHDGDPFRNGIPL